jgi:branched-chain amino acid transport system permease protein
MSSYLFQQIFNGIQLGSIYALIALGYTMVYGIIKLINFAHADIFMVGAYIAFFLIAFYTGSSAVLPKQVWIWLALIAGYLIFTLYVGRISFLKNLFLRLDAWPGSKKTFQEKIIPVALRGIIQLLVIGLCALIFLPALYYPSRFLISRLPPFLLFPFVIVYTMAVCGFLGLAMERIAYRPLRYKPRLSSLITALGVSLFLENFCSLPVVFSNQYQAFPELIQKSELLYIKALDLSISNIFILNIAVMGILLAGLWFLVEKTLIGKQMRAVAFDKKASSLMGIDVNRIISATFVIGSALAGVSGILYSMNYGILQSPFLGFTPGIKAFIAAVLGGIGSLPGAVIGALIMGITEVFANSLDSNLGFASGFVILIIILLLKPTGLFGKSENEKV